MGLRITGFAIWFHVDVRSRALTVDYKPRAIDENGVQHDVPVYNQQLHISSDALPEAMQRKLSRLAEAARFWTTTRSSARACRRFTTQAPARGIRPA